MVTFVYVHSNNEVMKYQDEFILRKSAPEGAMEDL